MAGYVRQETYSTGDTIEAADTSNEFNAIVSAFNSSTGHAHDGTASEGPRIVVTETTGGTLYGMLVLGGAGVQVATTAAVGAGELMVGQSAAVPAPKAVSGDATLATTGALTIGATVIAKTFVTDSGTVTPATSLINIVGGEGIDTSGSGATVTITGEDASTTNKGIMELATDAETVTGTSDVLVTTPGNITAKMSAPGAIGDVTPAAGNFTNIDATGTLDVTGVSTLTGGAITPSINGHGMWGNRNLIINGDMRISQRGTSFATLTAGQYTLDRWWWNDDGTTALVVTISQETFAGSAANVPTLAEAGTQFTNSLKVLATTGAGAVGTDEFVALFHRIEAQNCAHIGHGSTGAQTVAVSFWVKSKVTGTMCVTVERPDAAEKYTREITISSADTWERKTTTIPGDTSGTAITDDNGIGLDLRFTCIAGTGNDNGTADVWESNGGGANATANQTNLLLTTNDYVMLTGIQLEIGSTATDFEHRPIADELARCQRYTYNVPDPSAYANWMASGQALSTTMARFYLPFPVQMRTNSPTFSYTGTLNATQANGTADDATVTLVNSNPMGAMLQADGITLTAAGDATMLTRSSSGYCLFEDEL